MTVFRPAIALVMAALGLLAWDASSIWAATPVNPPPATGSTKSESQEPSHRVMLLGSTIYGAVSAPNAVYDVPWQEPFLLGKGAGELDRNFLKEIFKPVDREEFLKQSSP